VSVFLIIFVVSDVLSTIGPCKQAGPVHFTVFPLAFVSPAVIKEILSVALEVVGDDVPDIELAV
jgi:hypothetical protein